MDLGGASIGSLLRAFQRLCVWGQAQRLRHDIVSRFRAGGIVRQTSSSHIYADDAPAGMIYQLNLP